MYQRFFVSKKTHSKKIHENSFEKSTMKGMIKAKEVECLNEVLFCRGMLENAGTIVGQRSLQWDLSSIQSGLCMRIGPTSESTSMLEFVIDPNMDRGDRYLYDDTTGILELFFPIFCVYFFTRSYFHLTEFNFQLEFSQNSSLFHFS